MAFATSSVCKSDNWNACFCIFCNDRKFVMSEDGSTKSEDGRADLDEKLRIMNYETGIR
jgi:hypothetical protein